MARKLITVRVCDLHDGEQVRERSLSGSGSTATSTRLTRARDARPACAGSSAGSLPVPTGQPSCRICCRAGQAG